MLVSTILYFAAVGINLFWLWMGDRLSIAVQMSLPVLTMAVVGIAVMVRLQTLGAEQRSMYRRRVFWAILLYYVAILSVLLFFGGLFHLDRVWGGAVNLEPLHTISRFLRHYRRTGSLSSLSNLLGNVVILVPLGVLLPVMFRPMRRFWIFLPFTALVAVGVEYLQWLTRSGIADVDDSILNFFGAAVGYVLTRLCQMLYQFMKTKR